MLKRGEGRSPVEQRVVAGRGQGDGRVSQARQQRPAGLHSSRRGGASEHETSSARFARTAGQDHTGGNGGRAPGTPLCRPTRPHVGYRCHLKDARSKFWSSLTHRLIQAVNSHRYSPKNIGSCEQVLQLGIDTANYLVT
jgi:hypothetical protein